MVIATLCVALFGFSPRLNPLDIVAGRMFDVSVPKLVGMTQPQALLRLADKQLSGAVEFAYSAKVARGKVIKQTPAPLELRKRNSSVTVVVSRGPAIGPMPNLIGVTEQAAIEQLSDFEFDIKIDRVNDETIPKDQVQRQDPAAGVIVVGGATIHLGVSLGPVTRTVPEINAVTVEGAAFLLGKAGLTLGTITQADDDVIPVGGVISSDPPAGSVVERDRAIALTVSTGKLPVAIPDFTGKSQDSAAQRLTELGFIVGEVTQIGRIGDPQDGKVQSQNPPGGSMLKPGLVVTLTVIRAAKPPPAPTTIPPPPTVPEPTTTTTSTTLAPTPSSTTSTTVAAGG